MNDLLRQYYLSILTKQDYSSQDLIDRGLSKGYSGSEIKEVLTWLKEKGFLNDKRMAETIIDRYNGTKGKQWIFQKLKSKKLPQTIIEEVMSEFEQKVDINLRNKLIQKYKILDFAKMDPTTKQKVINYIARQGFSQPYTVLKSFEEE